MIRRHTQVLLLSVAALLAGACVGAPPVEAPAPLAPGGLRPEEPATASAPGVEGPAAASSSKTKPDLRTLAVADHMGRMTLEQKIGQRFLSFLPGTVMGEKTRAAISRLGLGGVVLSSQNIKTGDQLRGLIGELQGAAAESGVGLFVAVDQEGGRVARLQLPEITRFPPAFRWADHRDRRYVESVAYVTAREIARLGCNMNLAPVLDLYAHPDDTVIGDRSFGADPALAGVLGAAYVRASRDAGVLAVVKHFPGHGETVVDSHSTLPVVSTAADELRGRVVAPFRAALEAGAQAVMTAHVLYPELDATYPATMSRTIVEDLLRGELGFDGIVVSDAIEMAALLRNYPVDVILRETLNAGVDLVLVSGRFEVVELVETVKALVASGQVSEAEIERGVARILKVKHAYGLLAPGP